MSSLTSIFNFLYVYLNCFACFFFGGIFSVHDFNNAEQSEMARQIIIIASNGIFERAYEFSPKPILILFVGIFACGSIIGLVRRLIR